MSDDPRNKADPHRRRQLEALVVALGEWLPNSLFCVLVFDKEPLPGQQEARVNYIGNTSRYNLLAAIRRFLYVHEGKDGIGQLQDTIPLVVPPDAKEGEVMNLRFRLGPGKQVTELTLLRSIDGGGSTSPEPKAS